MTSFFINCCRFLKIIVNSLKNDGEFQFLSMLIILLLIGSNIFYVNVEHWSVVDSLYFSVMTMATIGYGDLTPSSDISKLFTVVYAFISIGTFVSFTAKCVQIMFTNHQKRNEIFHKKREHRRELKSETRNKTNNEKDKS